MLEQDRDTVGRTGADQVGQDQHAVTTVGLFDGLVNSDEFLAVSFTMVEGNGPDPVKLLADDKFRFRYQ
mgnify:CR=1 FL=1